MKGIIFEKEVFLNIIEGKITQTSSNKECEPGEIIFLKEPYRNCSEGLFYKWGRGGMKNYQMRNKTSMPEKFARYFIKIEHIEAQQSDIESKENPFFTYDFTLVLKKQ